jgi:GNAT superfamily N-acetyltransferase
MRIRRARNQDAAAACDVLRRSITELCRPDHGDDPALLDRWLANKTVENVRRWVAGTYMVVAEVDGDIAGVAAMTDSGHVVLNYVAPRFRFRGVSKALLRRLEHVAAELGCTAVTLESTRTAYAFYRAAGYRGAAGPDGKLMLVKDLARGRLRGPPEGAPPGAPLSGRNISRC